MKITLLLITGIFALINFTQSGATLPPPPPLAFPEEGTSCEVKEKIAIIEFNLHHMRQYLTFVQQQLVYLNQQMNLFREKLNNNNNNEPSQSQNSPG